MSKQISQTVRYNPVLYKNMEDVYNKYFKARGISWNSFLQSHSRMFLDTFVSGLKVGK